jgi:fatty-acyl-CoA synthase
LAWSTAVLRRGGTVVLMERFDAEEALALIARYRVTHGLFVPTMFVRMLKLPKAARAGHDVSSVRAALHVGGPCPPEVKRAMIDWWGPAIAEYYAGTEANGATFIAAADWLDHPGSVGRAVRGTVHICREDGVEQPAGQSGTVWFESDTRFEYHNDPDKTAGVHDSRGWSTLGDIGYLDEDGYLYLTDRAAFMIITGGVNVYPQEVENTLILHPAVADVAVFGVPNEEFGEEVKAVVQPAQGAVADGALARSIMDFGRDRLAHYKCPRSVDFVDALPRHDSGKLLKAALRQPYWDPR